MIVVDASAVILGLLRNGDARRLLATEMIIVPHLIDTEIASGLRRQVLTSTIRPEDGLAALRIWVSLGVQRLGVTGLTERVWQLRNNLTAYDAAYVALAEAHECALLTADIRMVNAPGPECIMNVVRS